MWGCVNLEWISISFLTSEGGREGGRDMMWERGSPLGSVIGKKRREGGREGGKDEKVTHLDATPHLLPVVALRAF